MKKKKAKSVQPLTKEEVDQFKTACLEWYSLDKKKLVIALEYGPKVAGLKEWVRNKGYLWEQWTPQNLGVTTATLNNWSKVSRNRKTIERWCEQNHKSISDLGLVDALNLIPKSA